MTVDLEEQVFLKKPDEILSKVATILQGYLLPVDEQEIRSAFKDTLLLFQGFYPGYQKSQTPYHDLSHTLGVFLAAGRLIHGACLSGEKMASDTIRLGLLCALFHDAGLIKKEGENGGSGAQFTIGHEERSVGFLSRYLDAHNGSRKETAVGMKLIRATNLSIHIQDISLPDREITLMAKILAASDLIAQISDRAYAEKLRLLYQEFMEGQVPGYASEWDLYVKTEGFYLNVVQARLNKDLDGVCSYLFCHFMQDRGEKRDYYLEHMQKNITFIQDLVLDGPFLYRNRLRRQCVYPM